MRTQSMDTSPEAERVQIELIRKASPAKRFAIMEAWSQFLIEANKQGIRRNHPEATEEEIELMFVANNYGQALADKLRAELVRRKGAMSDSNIGYVLAALTSVAEILEHLHVSYFISGSMASSIQGIPRSAIDADLIAELKLEHVDRFVKHLETNYYINADSVRDAIRRRSFFNVIHLETILKIDVFITKSRLFDQEEMHRASFRPITEGTRPFYIASPEGTILNKLEWFRMGGEVSNSQWNDILGVLKVQGTRLDMAYLHRWASALNVSDLLGRALEDAGLGE